MLDQESKLYTCIEDVNVRLLGHHVMCLSVIFIDRVAQKKLNMHA